MIRCATMQSAMIRYLSSRYYYIILSLVMMPKEGMVCVIVFFDNKNQVSISIIKKVMIILLIL